MKCTCGYESVIKYENFEKIVTKGDEEFMRTKFEISYDSENDYYSDLKSSPVYICPKCGTLKIDL